MGRKKNRHLHFVTDEDLYQSIDKLSKDLGISKAEICRIKLRSEKPPIKEEILILREFIQLIEKRKLAK